jgi:hypothetical protein
VPVTFPAVVYHRFASDGCSVFTHGGLLARSGFDSGGFGEVMSWRS